MKRPLVFICVFFIAGIFCAQTVKFPFAGVYAALVFCLAAAFFSLRAQARFAAALAGAGFFLGAALMADAVSLPKNHISRFVPGRSVAAKAAGTVVSDPQRQKKATVFIMEAGKLFDSGGTAVPVRGRILVRNYLDGEIRRGQKLILSGKLYRPFDFPGSGRFSYRNYLHRREIFAIMSVSKPGSVRLCGETRGNPLNRILNDSRSRIERLMDEHMSPDAAGIMKAIMLGLRGAAPREINLSLQRSGTVHVLAISGLHIMMIGLIILTVLHLFSVPFPWRYLAAVFLLVVYCLFTGGRVSVVRATIMAVIFCLGLVLRRDYAPYNGLALAAMVILWNNPRQLFDLGFQLSFLSVLFIFLFGKKIIAFMPPRFMRFNAVRRIWQGISISLAAWLGTAGIIAWNFNMITPVALLANLAIIPLLFVLLCSGLVFVILGLCLPAAAGPLALNCEFLVHLIYRVNAVFVALPGAYYEISDVSAAAVTAFYAGIFILFALYAFFRRAEAREPRFPGRDIRA